MVPHRRDSRVQGRHFHQVPCVNVPDSESAIVAHRREFWLHRVHGDGTTFARVVADRDGPTLHVGAVGGADLVDLASLGAHQYASAVLREADRANLKGECVC